MYCPAQELNSQPQVMSHTFYKHFVTPVNGNCLASRERKKLRQFPPRRLFSIAFRQAIWYSCWVVGKLMNTVAILLPGFIGFAELKLLLGIWGPLFGDGGRVFLFMWGPHYENNLLPHSRLVGSWLVGWLVGFYGMSTFVD